MYSAVQCVRSIMFLASLYQHSEVCFGHHGSMCIIHQTQYNMWSILLYREV